MKRVMTLIVVMVAILFSQPAFAQMEFQVSEPVLTEVGEVQDQGVAGVAAAGFKVIPLQAFTARLSDSLPWAWWQLGEEYWFSGLFTVSGTGTYYIRIKVTDVKTGLSARFPKMGPYNASGGLAYSISSQLSASALPGVPVQLPRPLILTYEFKVGTIWKAVSTKVWYYQAAP